MHVSRLGDYLDKGFWFICFCFLIYVIATGSMKAEWLSFIGSIVFIFITLLAIIAVINLVNRIWNKRNCLLQEECHFTVARWVCGLAVLAWWFAMPALFYAKTIIHPYLARASIWVVVFELMGLGVWAGVRVWNWIEHHEQNYWERRYPRRSSDHDESSDNPRRT